MKHISLTLMTMVAPFIAQAQLSLDDCQQRARTNYPLIKQYELIGKSEEYTLSNAGKAYLPQISATAIGGYIIKGLPPLGPTSESADKVQFIGIGQVNQTIWDGGATKAQKDIVRVSSDLEEAGLDVAFHDLQKRVNQLFFGVLLLDEQLKQVNVLIDNLNRNLNAVKVSNENGIAFSSDVDEVKVEILKAGQRVADITFARQGYARMLAMMIGDPQNTNLQLVKPAGGEAPGTAEINRPELNMYRNQLLMVDAEMAMKKVGNMPKVGLLGAGVMIQPGMGFGAEKIQSLAIAGLSVSWNTRTVYQSSNNNQLAQIQRDRITSQQEAFLFNTGIQLAQQSSDIEKQRDILVKDREIVALRASIKKAYEVKYQNGMSTMNDLLRATSNESDAQASQAMHEIQLLLTISEFENTSGN
jgi:outer membrane protein TolC